LACCPVCASDRIVVVIRPEPRAFCVICGARWTVEGDKRTNIQPRRVNPEHPSVRGKK
jgi:hypothetical protein